MQRIILPIITLTLFCGSCQKYPASVERVLSYSNTNRPELEKALQHYAQHPEDSLKFQAALFLIENMPGHYTLES